VGTTRWCVAPNFGHELNSGVGPRLGSEHEEEDACNHVVVLETRSAGLDGERPSLHMHEHTHTHTYTYTYTYTYTHTPEKVLKRGHAHSKTRTDAVKRVQTDTQADRQTDRQTDTHTSKRSTKSTESPPLTHTGRRDTKSTQTDRSTTHTHTHTRTHTRRRGKKSNDGEQIRLRHAPQNL